MKQSIKFVTLIAFLILQAICVSGQVYKWKASTFSMKYERNGKWTDWDEPVESGVLITFDIDNSRVKIYSKKLQVFDVVYSHGTETDIDGDEIFRLSAVDSEGIDCSLRIVTLNSQGGRKQLYIDYEYLTALYNIYKVD